MIPRSSRRFDNFGTRCDKTLKTVTSVNAGRRCIIAAVTLLFWMSPASAAMISLQEAGVEQIYSQAGFSAPIDFRYRAPQELVAPGLLAIDDTAEFSAISGETFGLGLSTIRLFFVDDIEWCGSPGSGIAGCAGGRTIVLDSGIAAGSIGDELIAHEVGHLLGLRHGGTHLIDHDGDPNTPPQTPTPLDPDDDVNTNLMWPSIGNNRHDLTTVQIAEIFNSPGLLQQDLDGFFLDIAPIVVVASATVVPVPGAILLMLGALLPLGAARRRA